MSKINRFDGNYKAFASEQLTNERTTFGTEVISDDLTAQQTPEYLRGMAIVGPSQFPTLQDFNAVNYTATQSIAYIHQMGVPEWSADQEYPTEGATCIYNGVQWFRKSTWTLGDEPGASGSWRANIQHINTIAGLQGLVGSSGQKISVGMYRDIADLSGGGALIWNPNRLKASHDGFRYFDPLKTFPSDWSNEAQKLAWFIGDNVGNGVWERPADTVLTLGMGGANVNVAYSSSVEIQNCLNKRVALKAGDGTYIVSTSLVYDTTGKGEVTGLRLSGAGKYDTVFDNRTGGEMLQLEAGTGITDFQRGLDITGFTIDDTTSSATSIGLFSTSNFRGFIGDILVKNQGLDGLYFSSTVGDATDNYQITLRRVESQNNGRHGMLISGDPNAINGGFDVQHCAFINNGGLGIAAYSCTSSTFARNGFAYNLGGGIVVSHAGGPFSKNNEIYNNEFDSNAGVQILIDYALNTDVGLNYFVVNTGAPVVTDLIKITTNSRNTTIRKSQPRMPSGYTGVTAFTIESGSFGNIILDTDWSSWESAGNTKFNDLALDTIIRDENQFFKIPTRGVEFPSTQVPSIQPNVLDDYEEATTWAPTITNVVNLTTGIVTGVHATKIGNSAHLEFAVSAEVLATDIVSFDFLLPWPSKDSPSKAIGAALEAAATLETGVVYDVDGGGDSTFRVRFNSISAGVGREIRVSMDYITK